MTNAMRFSRNAGDSPSLLVPCRMDVFGTVVSATGRPTKKRPYTPIAFRAAGWQAWNSDTTMETRMSRLRESGSFYWPNALRAAQEARRLLRTNPRVTQIKIETISGVEIGRYYRA